ncbi:hypothetical protein WG909_08130 [Peptostreptococcaceae bacterium AGR-M142]
MEILGCLFLISLIAMILFKVNGKKTNTNKNKLVSECTKNLFIIILILTGMSFIIPFFLEIFVYRNQYNSTLNNAELASFLGSFLGGIIGGGMTLITMIYSIKETRKDFNKSEIYRNRSYLDIFGKVSKSGILKEIRGDYKNAKIVIDEYYSFLLKNKTEIIKENKGIRFIGIKNCGPTILRNIDIEIKDEFNRSKYVNLNRILVEEVIFIPFIHESYDNIDCFIEQINISCISLSNEVMKIEKTFSKDYSYEEKIDFYMNMNNNMNKKINKLKDINLF